MPTLIRAPFFFVWILILGSFFPPLFFSFSPSPVRIHVPRLRGLVQFFCAEYTDSVFLPSTIGALLISALWYFLWTVFVWLLIPLVSAEPGRRHKTLLYLIARSIHGAGRIIPHVATPLGSIRS